MKMLNLRKSVSAGSCGKVIILSICFILCLSVDTFSSWPEFWLSSICFPDNAYEDQLSPSIARGETNLLAVWEDERIVTDRDIFGTRISPGGEILDPVGIPICTASGLQTSVKVAGGDQNYLVVWQDDRNGTYDIYGARIDLEGNVLDPDGIPISTGSGWEAYPDVAWDGTNFFVVWSDDRNMISYDIYGTRITSDGEMLDGGGIQISFDLAMEVNPSITYNGFNYLVAWQLGAG